jgi:large subunit ribosomal protein L23
MDLLKARSVIISPLTTEKNVAREAQHKYTFRVERSANKKEIKQAIEKIFKVKVLGINTAIFEGKNKRVRYQLGRTASWKKAVVTVRPEDKIEFA